MHVHCLQGVYIHAIIASAEAGRQTTFSVISGTTQTSKQSSHSLIEGLRRENVRWWESQAGAHQSWRAQMYTIKGAKMVGDQRLQSAEAKRTGRRKAQLPLRQLLSLTTLTSAIAF